MSLKAVKAALAQKHKDVKHKELNQKIKNQSESAHSSGIIQAECFIIL